MDHWQHNGGGSWLNEERSTTEEFVNDFVSQLPVEIPVFIMPGNHEQFSNDDWDYITGNDRYGYYVLGEHLFVFLDNFAGELDPDYHHDGVYTGADTAYIEKLMVDMGPNYNIRVVTDDRLLQFSAVHSGILRMTAKEFEAEVVAVSNEITAAAATVTVRGKVLLAQSK